MSVTFLGTSLSTWIRIGLLFAVSFFIWWPWYAWFISRRHGILYAIVGAQLFSIAQICLTELALGLVGLLYVGWLIAINMGVASVILWRGWWIHRKEVSQYHSTCWERIRTAHKSIVAGFVVLTFLSITVWNLFLGWFLPPLQWDGLAYHLPIMAAFYQAKAVFPIQTTSVWIRYYPINGELIGLWPLILVGVDKLVDWSFVPSILGGLVALYGLCRRMGARPTQALLGTSLMGFAPGILIQQTGTMNDAFFASLVAMGTFAIMGEAPVDGEDRSRYIWPSSLGMAAAGGLLAGLKYSGVVYAFGLLFLFAVTWIQPRTFLLNKFLENHHFLKQRLPVVLLSFLLFIGLGMYPYLRNLVTVQNPLAPFQIQVGETVLLAGDKRIGDYVDVTQTSNTSNSLGVFARIVNAWFEPYRSVYELDINGFGPLWIVIGVPALLFWLVDSLRYRRTGAVVLIGCLLACSLLTPDFWHPRYIFSLLILGGMATAVVLEKLNPWVRRFVIAEIVFLILFSAYNTVAPNRVSPGDFWNVLRAQNDQTRSSPQFIQPTEGRAAYAWIDNFTLDNPSIIAFGKLIYFPYSFHGTDFRNRVVYFLPGSENDWDKVLEKTNTNLVVVLDWTPNYTWMKNMSDFLEVFRDGQYVIFRRAQGS